MQKNSIEKFQNIIARAKPKEQREFLAVLPYLLKVSMTDLTLLKMSEPSFRFWNNKQDEIYDEL